MGKKGMGGGMPVGAYRINRNDDLLSDNPKLGHITTFGHPVIASACLATLQEIETNRPDGQN
jgi:acetylornithine/succinyldiaminopimelate/putrescine aminotransferase